MAGRLAATALTVAGRRVAWECRTDPVLGGGGRPCSSLPRPGGPRPTSRPACTLS